MAEGHIILLNGTSSAGKSTLAATLQKALDKPYLNLSIDEYLDRFTDHISAFRKIGQSVFPRRSASAKFPVENLKPPERGPGIVYQMVPRFHQSIAAKANAGQRVIVDHILLERKWLEECVKLFEGIEVIFVGVHCSLEELKRRERKRGDRVIGLARSQYKKVHIYGVYDIEVDTTVLSPEACAAKIIGYLKSDETPTAFEQLRRKMGNDTGTEN